MPSRARRPRAPAGRAPGAVLGATAAAVAALALPAPAVVGGEICARVTVDVGGGPVPLGQCEPYQGSTVCQTANPDSQHVRVTARVCVPAP